MTDPIQIIVTPTLVRFTVRGTATITVFAAALRTVLTNPAIPSSTPMLWDLRQARLDLTGPQLANAVAGLAGSLRQRALHKTAIVVASDAAYGLSRLGSTHADAQQLPAIIQIFRELSAALIWLGVPDELAVGDDPLP